MPLFSIVFTKEPKFRFLRLILTLHFCFQVVEYCKIGWVKATPVKSIQNVETEKPMEEIKRNKPLNAAQPIKVTLYYESLCPDCKQFILYQLYPTYQALASSGILELKLVPYGNARVSTFLVLLRIKQFLYDA